MMHDAGGRELDSEIIQIIGRGARKARFVSEVAHELARSNATSPDELEHGLDQLEASGRALVRAQYCGDPHLEGADLRIVALVQAGAPADGAGQQDPMARAIADIEAVWGRWLGEYLSNHRCG